MTGVPYYNNQGQCLVHQVKKYKEKQEIKARATQNSVKQEEQAVQICTSQENKH